MIIRCCRCKAEKDSTEYCNNKSKPTGKDSMCKLCRREYNNINAEMHRSDKRARNKLYYYNNADKIRNKTKVYRIINKGNIKEKEKEYKLKHKDRYNELSKEWQKRNPVRAKAIQKKTVKKNWDKILEAQRKRREINPKYRITNRMRSGFKSWLNGKQKTCSVMDLISLSKEEFVDYIEKQFTEGMNWNNIHIDHYIPLSYFDPENINDMYICWNYLNLRPLFAIDNMSKNNILPINYKEHIEMIKQFLTTASTRLAVRTVTFLTLSIPSLLSQVR
jgi:hypothetical protein